MEVLEDRALRSHDADRGRPRNVLQSASDIALGVMYIW